MEKNFFKIILLFIPLLINSCENVTSPVIQNNLLQNPSFEENGQPSLSGWTVIDTAMINFSNDVPPGGGKWSLFMYGYNPLSLQPILLSPLIQKVNLLKGSYIYTFSFWAKADSTVHSAAFFRAFKNDTLKVDKDIEITNSNWTNYNIVDTLASADYDSVEVLFHDGYSFVYVQGKTFFDLCSLTTK
ncbi:MAG: carbohydrate binding domain-containing protein [Ignavibacteriaceae bacterium]